MPQPLSKVGVASSYTFDTDALATARPKQTILVMKVIAGWSAVEAALGIAFVDLLGAKTPVAMEIYAAFDSFSVQRTILLTAAEKILPKKYSNVFEKTLKAIKGTADHRHAFAHGILGIPLDENLQDAILVAQPENLWRGRIATKKWSKKVAKDFGKPVLVPPVPPGVDRSAIHVYRTKELEQIVEQIERDFRCVQALRFLVDKQPTRRRLGYDWLRKEPRIRAALEQDRLRLAEQKKVQRERDRQFAAKAQEAHRRKRLKAEYKKKTTAA